MSEITEFPIATKEFDPDNFRGKEVEVQVGSNHIQWRYTGETDWTDLISLDELTGPQGPQGEQGIQGEQGEQGDQGEQGPKGDTPPLSEDGSITTIIALSQSDYDAISDPDSTTLYLIR